MEHIEEYDKSPVRYGDFGTRLLAQIIDGIIVTFLVILVFVLLLSPIILGSDPSDTTEGILAVSAILYYLFGIPLTFLFYRSLFEGSKRQATPGKITMKLKVVNYNYQPISMGQAFGRNLSKILSSFLLIGYLISLGNKKVQTLHDQIANTYVVFK